jgi:hypothetical protein
MIDIFRILNYSFVHFTTKLQNEGNDTVFIYMYYIIIAKV